METFEDDDWQPPSEAELKVIQAKRERQDKISKILGDYLLKGYKMLSTSCRQCETILLRDKQGVDYCVACRELDSDSVKDDPALSTEAARRQAQEQSQRTSAEHTPSDDELQMLPGISMDTRLPGSLALPGMSMDTRQQGGLEAKPDVSDMAGDSPRASRPDFVPVSMRLSRPDITRHTTSDIFSVAMDTHSPLMVRNAERVSTQPRQAATLPLRQATDGQSRGHIPGVEVTVASALSSLQSKMAWAVYEMNHTSNIDRSTQLCQLIRNAAEATEAIQRAYPHKC